MSMTIGFIGNPNCGKTTLFNAYTGANLNFPEHTASPPTPWRSRLPETS